MGAHQDLDGKNLLLKIKHGMVTGYGEIRLVLNRKLPFLTSLCSTRGCCVSFGGGEVGGVINSQ